MPLDQSEGSIYLMRAIIEIIESKLDYWQQLHNAVTIINCMFIIEFCNSGWTRVKYSNETNCIENTGMPRMFNKYAGKITW